MIQFDTHISFNSRQAVRRRVGDSAHREERLLLRSFCVSSRESSVWVGDWPMGDVTVGFELIDLSVFFQRC